MSSQHYLILLVSLGLMSGVVSASQPTADVVEVAFVLDTTASMSGLIENAKEKIWKIANVIRNTQPNAEIRFGLIGYRDIHDEYVTQLHPLTTDLDAIYVNLQRYRALGGGDGPESVNQALFEAVELLDWSPDNGQKRYLRSIFLVGDYPPHMDYSHDVPYPEVCSLAQQKNIIVNTIQCGTHYETERVWREIAQLGGGRYVNIQQDGGMKRDIPTPYDEEIQDLNRKLVDLSEVYGSTHQQTITREKKRALRRASIEQHADRNAYMSGGYGGYGGYDGYGKSKSAPASLSFSMFTGIGDFISDLMSGSIEAGSVPEDELPSEYKGMSAEEIQETAQKKSKDRAGTYAKLDELVKQRAEYLKANKVADDDAPNGFEAQVEQILLSSISEIKEPDVVQST